MITFQLNEAKKISIKNLTNEVLNEDWKYYWYACRDKNCAKSDNTFYSVKDRNDDNILDEWVADMQVEFEFFETNTPNQQSFYICILIDKNDNESEPCFYSVEVKVIEGRVPEIILDLSELDCLNTIGQTKNIEITGKLSVKFAPKLYNVF